MGGGGTRFINTMILLLYKILPLAYAAISVGRLQGSLGTGPQPLAKTAPALPRRVHFPRLRLR